MTELTMHRTRISGQDWSAWKPGPAPTVSAPYEVEETTFVPVGEVERLRAALTPFADAAGTTDANDDYSSASIWEHPSALDITIGDLRRAARALSSEGV